MRPVRTPANRAAYAPMVIAWTNALTTSAMMSCQDQNGISAGAP